MIHTYRKHEREYTVVGVTAAFNAIMLQSFIDFYSTQWDEIISVIKDGRFYHYQRDGLREVSATEFLQKVANDEYDLEALYDVFDRTVTEYESFIEQDESSFTRETILELYRYYTDLINVAVAGLDPIDMIDSLDETHQAQFRAWSEKVRRREEVVYKHGEMKFVPRFLTWLQKAHLPEYTVDQLNYILFSEMRAYVENDASLPTPSELDARNELCFIRQTPVGNIECKVGKEAQKIIDEMGLLSIDDSLAGMEELAGRTAYKGTVQGKVRIIRARADMGQFQDGEVLVTSMTDPSYLPIMKRAAAFVTNEGGTLCHAAIVARELGKPCVIGTRHATHVFRDGELVEVDATNAIVRKV